MRFISFFLFLFIPVLSFGEVFVMPMEDAGKPGEKAEQSRAVKPVQDDEMLSSRQINEFIRYTICGVKTTDILIKDTKTSEQNTSDSNDATDSKTIRDSYIQNICGVYYASSGAAGKGLAVNAALKDLGDVSDLTIKEATVVKTNKNDFDIKDKKPVAAKSFNGEGVYKKVLTSRKKIRLLYNYADLPLAWRINALMDKRGSTQLPVRITFYEDTSAENPPAYAVVVFKAKADSLAAMYNGGAALGNSGNIEDNISANNKTKEGNSKKSFSKNNKTKTGVMIVPLQEEKYLESLTDTLPFSSDIYGIRPDNVYFYK